VGLASGLGDTFALLEPSGTLGLPGTDAAGVGGAAGGDTLAVGGNALGPGDPLGLLLGCDTALLRPLVASLGCGTCSSTQAGNLAGLLADLLGVPLNLTPAHKLGMLLSTSLAVQLLAAGDTGTVLGTTLPGAGASDGLVLALLADVRLVDTFALARGLGPALPGLGSALLGGALLPCAL